MSESMSGDGQQHYADAIEAGRLEFQHCRACDQSWLPPADFCPACLSEDYEWRVASGTATLTSWVIYHIEYRADFHDRLPYNVSLVKLAEGPQLITNVVSFDAATELVSEVDHGALTAGLELRLRVARWSPDQPLLALFDIAD